jgi:predicted lipid-binding transport protein (Tim44 family)
VRSRLVELAAEESLTDDPMFAPEVVKAAAAELQAEVMAAWMAADRRRLRAILAPDLLVEWEQQLAEFRRRGWRSVQQLRGRLRVRYVGLVNRPGDNEDRVIVHLRARMYDIVYDRTGQRILRSVDDTGKRRLSEYWTLGKRDGRWMIVSVEQGREGAYHLDDAVIPSPWADDRLYDDAVIERGAAAMLPPDTLTGVLGSVPFEFRGGTRSAALDLAQFDGRYAPDVLESATRRAVAAWAEAIDGDDRALIALAGPYTAAALIYPEGTHRSRLVIRGPRLVRLEIIHLDPAARPPTMTVEATITARRYLESRRTGAVLEGTKDRDVRLTEHWVLALTAKPDVPWRITCRHGREELTIATRIDRAVGRALDWLLVNLWPRRLP